MKAFLALVKVIKECRDARQRGLLLVFYLDGELDFHLADAAQVGYAVQCCHQAHALAAQYGLAVLHLVHAIVYHHLEIVHLDDLLPHIGQQ